MEDVQSHVVVGEAEESADDADADGDQREVNTLPPVDNDAVPCKPKSQQAIVVTGEAPESDEESPRPKIADVSKDEVRQSTTRQTNVSLLHRKLYECNASLEANVISFICKTVDKAVSQLSETERELLKSQMRLQNAGTALRMLNNTSDRLGDELSNISCTSYIPHIDIPR